MKISHFLGHRDRYPGLTFTVKMLEAAEPAMGIVIKSKLLKIVKSLKPLFCGRFQT
jgi:hypothetical protein